MWELDYKESWALKNWCFWTVVLDKTLSVPWTTRRPNQSILKEISPEYSLERLMLKLKLQYFGHLVGRIDSLEKTLMLGKIEGWRRRGWQRIRWLDDITDSMGMSLSKLREFDGQGGLVCCSPWGRKESEMTERMSWTEPDFALDIHGFIPLLRCYLWGIPPTTPPHTMLSKYYYFPFFIFRTYIYLLHKRYSIC